MARTSYYLNTELYIDSNLSVAELERIIEDALTIYRQDVQVSPSRIDLNSPRKI